MKVKELVRELNQFDPDSLVEIKPARFDFHHVLRVKEPEKPFEEEIKI